MLHDYAYILHWFLTWMVKSDRVGEWLWSIGEDVCILNQSLNKVVIPIDANNFCRSKRKSENITVLFTEQTICLGFTQIQS